MKFKEFFFSFIQEVQAVGETLFPPLLCAAARNGDLNSIRYMEKVVGKSLSDDIRP